MKSDAKNNKTDVAVQEFFRGCKTDKEHWQRLQAVAIRMDITAETPVLPQFHWENGDMLMPVTAKCGRPPLIQSEVSDLDPDQEFVLPADFAKMAELIMGYQQRFQQYLTRTCTDSDGTPIMEHFAHDNRARYLQNLARKAGGNAMAIEPVGAEGLMKMIYHRSPALRESTLPEACQQLSHLSSSQLDAIHDGNTFYFLMPLHYHLLHNLLQHDVAAYQDR